jgi:O-acetyl-ADP-ribose deacetylase (regulator of RNase III)
MQPKLTSYLFGNRELLILVDDLLSASTDVIVNPANSGLSHCGGLETQISLAAGDIHQHGGEGSEQLEIEQAISNCLKLCDENQWNSIALPAIITGIFSVPLNYSAQGFYQAINHYWSIHADSHINQIMVHLDDEHYNEFTQIIESQINQDEATIHLLFAEPIIRMGDIEEDEDNASSTGYVDLSNATNTDKNSKVDDDIDKWFT